MSNKKYTSSNAEKYASRNPIHRYLINGFIKQLIELVDIVHPQNILEVGCGEGFLAMALAKKGCKVHGIDINEGAIEFAKEKSQASGLSQLLTFEVGNLYDIKIDNSKVDLLICCEVLEHLEKPDDALDILCKIAADAIFSVPEEPMWRALNMIRLKYLREFGNSPGHINHWSKNSFIDLLTRKYSVKKCVSPLPWTMALCTKVV